MSIIHSLNLSEGGGIFPKNDISLPEDAASVIIGIGGTGVAALKTLKKKVYTQLEPSNPGDPVPSYNMIRFLALDTDETSLGDPKSESDLSSTEFVSLCVPHLDALLDPHSPTGRTALKQRPDLNKWMSIDQIQPLLAEAGAGGIRQMGRFMLFQNVSNVYNAIYSAINDAQTGIAAGGQVNIHIVAGISGGTGSGCFIDVCYLVRAVLMANGWNGKLFGYFFLPDVVISKEAVRSDALKVHANRRNGYAAFRELDYLMDLASANDWFDQTYQGAVPPLHTQKPPVDLCHLISATDAHGNIPEKAFDYSLNVVSDYIMAYLAHVDLTGVTAGQDQGLTMQGHLANIVAGVELVAREAGANHCYTILGASNAEVPFSQIATYLAQGYYGKVASISGHSPTENEVKKFAADENLTWDKLRAELTKNAHDSASLAARLGDVQMGDCVGAPIRGDNEHPEALLTPAQEWLANYEGAVESNFSALGTALSSYKEPVLGQNNSIISSVHRHLMDLCRNQDGAHGAKFAAELLSRNGFDMNDIIAGLIRTNSEKLKTEENQTSVLLRNLREARDDFNRASFLTRSSKWNSYRDAMVRWMDHEARIFVMEKMDALLLTLKSQLSTLYTEFYHKLDSLCDDLKDTFAQNSAFLADPAKRASANPYTWRIIELDDVKGDLDPVINAINPIQATGALMDHLLQLQSQDEWRSESDYRIGRLVNGFMCEKFQTQLNATLETYIRSKYPGLNDTQIQQKIENDFLKPANQKATPMFWKIPAYSLDSTTTFVSSTLTIPAASVLVTAAAQSFIKGAGNGLGYAIRRSDIGDRIFALRFNSGMPLYAYQGVTLMRADYDNDLRGGIAGLHLFEHNCVLDDKPNKTPEDMEVIASTAWGSYLPSPIPLSRTYTQGQAHSEQHKALEELFKRATELGVIAQDAGNNWVIYENPWNSEHTFPTRNDYVNEGVFNYGQAEADKAECDNLLTSWTSPADCRSYTLLSNVVIKPGYGEKVLLDRFVRYPRLVAIVRRNLDNYDFLQQKKAVIAEIISKETKHAGILQQFTDALVTGAINRGIGRITFTEMQYGLEIEVRLDNEPAALGALFLLYKGYTGFKALSDGQLQTIAQKANDKLNNLQPGDDAIANDLRRQLKNSISSIAQQASTMPTAQRSEIMNFYSNLRNSLEAYCQQFPGYVPFNLLQ